VKRFSCRNYGAGNAVSNSLEATELSLRKAKVERERELQYSS